MIQSFTNKDSPLWRSARPYVLFGGNLFFVLSIFAAHVPAGLAVGLAWRGAVTLGEGRVPPPNAQAVLPAAPVSPTERIAAVCGWGLGAVVFAAHALVLLGRLSAPRDVGRAYGRLLELTLILSVFPSLAIYLGIHYCPSQAVPAMRIGYLAAGLLVSTFLLAVILKAIRLARRACAATRFS